MSTRFGLTVSSCSGFSRDLDFIWGLRWQIMTRPTKTEAWRAIVLEQAEMLRDAVGDETFDWLEEKVNEKDMP